MTRLSSSSSSFLFYAACVQLIALRCVCDGLSIKSTTYYDSMCDQPTGAMTHTYGNLHVDPEDGFTTLGETYTYSSRVVVSEASKEKPRGNTWKRRSCSRLLVGLRWGGSVVVLLLPVAAATPSIIQPYVLGAVRCPFYLLIVPVVVLLCSPRGVFRCVFDYSASRPLLGVRQEESSRSPRRCCCVGLGCGLWVVGCAVPVALVYDIRSAVSLLHVFEVCCVLSSCVWFVMIILCRDLWVRVKGGVPNDNEKL